MQVKNRICNKWRRVDQESKITTGKKFCREKMQLDFYILPAALGRFRMNRQTESPGCGAIKKTKSTQQSTVSKPIIHSIWTPSCLGQHYTPFLLKTCWLLGNRSRNVAAAHRGRCRCSWFLPACREKLCLQHKMHCCNKELERDNHASEQLPYITYFLYNGTRKAYCCCHRNTEAIRAVTCTWLGLGRVRAAAVTPVIRTRVKSVGWHTIAPNTLSATSTRRATCSETWVALSPTPEQSRELHASDTGWPSVAAIGCTQPQFSTKILTDADLWPYRFY